MMAHIFNWIAVANQVLGGLIVISLGAFCAFIYKSIRRYFKEAQERQKLLAECLTEIKELVLKHSALHKRVDGHTSRLNKIEITVEKLAEKHK